MLYLSNKRTATRMLLDAQKVKLLLRNAYGYDAHISPNGIIDIPPAMARVQFAGGTILNAPGTQSQSAAGYPQRDTGPTSAKGRANMLGRGPNGGLTRAPKDPTLTFGKVRANPNAQRRANIQFARQVDRNSHAAQLLAGMGVGQAGTAAQTAGIGGITGIYSSSEVPRTVPKPRNR